MPNSPAPLVSVIMPAFDAKAWLPDAAASLLNQKYRHWELIVVSDDGCDYRSLLPGDSRIRQFSSARYASGPGAARNIGLRHARGDLVAHLDVDDIFYPERLERLVPLAMEHGGALDNMRILDFERGIEIGTLFEQGRSSLSFVEALELNHPIFPVYRKSLLGEWDEDILFAEDVLFNLRVISRVCRIPVLDGQWMDYRVRFGSVSCSADSGWRAERAYRKILGELDASGLGFCPSRRDEVRRMFERKAHLNRKFLNSNGGEGIKSFAEYAAILDAERKVQQNSACS